MNRLFTVMLLAALMVNSYACFDTFLFMNRGSMVYPKNTLAVEAFGEYSFNSFGAPVEDGFLADARVFYGLSDRVSFQIGFGSDEKPRGQFAFDAISASGTFNILRKPGGSYSLDGILACQGNTENGAYSVEVSAPSIFRRSGFVIVAHPVVELIKENEFDATFGAHMGVFRAFDNGAVLGIGAEYQSGQGGPYFSDRLVEGEAAASIFLGAMIGKNLFIQNEIAKGLANSRDMGFAITLKGVFKTR